MENYTFCRNNFDYLEEILAASIILTAIGNIVPGLGPILGILIIISMVITFLVLTYQLGRGTLRVNLNLDRPLLWVMLVFSIINLFITAFRTF